MSELEPTITKLEPTATERLRALLDERGVEYTDRDMFGKHVFHWGEPLHGAMFTDGGEWTELVVENAAPEQAIAATLGQEDIYTREDMEGAFVSGYSLGSLPVGSDPRWDENSQTVDEHMAELGWVRKEAATMDDSDATEARRSDAVEVVRCRDCEHARHYHPFYMGKRSSIEEWYCEWHSNAEGASEIEPDGFCAWASRKESE
jgi:hypothetical protein